jgi:UDP-N-acetylglucosamine--N-acetylmuramyl-(pentapeptide) pyrophosphoryl-undecaprenol N-acetylglucosamine transferase
VSRAGASSISELCLLGKASILIPSPNVAEDHQTHNAMALVRKDAAILVKDIECADKLLPAIQNLLNDKQRQQTMKKNILSLAQTDSAARIADEVIKIAKNNAKK